MIVLGSAQEGLSSAKRASFLFSAGAHCSGSAVAVRRERELGLALARRRAVCTRVWRTLPRAVRVAHARAQPRDLGAPSLHPRRFGPCSGLDPRVRRTLPSRATRLGSGGRACKAKGLSQLSSSSLRSFE